jgi:transcriptional regulator
MYQLPSYQTDDPEQVVQFMKSHPFALMAVNGSDWPAVTRLPLLIKQQDEKLYLRGHLMKKTDHHLALEKLRKALFVFSGPGSYVSASWYKNPAVGSTWNYTSVHAQTSIRFLDDAELITLLEETTTLFEGNPDSPASFSHLPQAYVQQHLKAIVGFEAEVLHLSHVFKLSQDKDPETVQYIIQQLEKGSEDAKSVAAAMKDGENNLNA